MPKTVSKISKTGFVTEVPLVKNYGLYYYIPVKFFLYVRLSLVRVSLYHSVGEN